MYPIERQKAILEILEKKAAASVRELSQTLYIGEATIRRDLFLMNKDGQLLRTHGGAVRISTANVEVPFVMRESSQIKQKEELAKTAALLVKSGQTIFMDSSSTVLKMIPYIKNLKQLIVITNGIKTAYELGQQGVQTICSGGALNNSTTTLCGSDAIATASKYFADYFFFSARAINLSGGILDSSTEACAIKQAMANNSTKSVLVIDSEKFNKTAFARLDLLQKTDYIITDFTPTPAWQSFFTTHKIKLLQPN